MTPIQEQIRLACRRLLSELDRNPYSPTYGCFDRRYWAWKLVDFPETTFQRNSFPLAWLLNSTIDHNLPVTALREAAIAGLLFTVSQQHRDGSFDQAFPNEHSYGATAFLFSPIHMALQIVEGDISPEEREKVLGCLKKMAEFLTTNDECHGMISNHLAGAALSLHSAAHLFGEERFASKSETLLQRIFSHQSDEGWYMEYYGADPGYQTLCLYYLAQLHRLRPSKQLHESLEKALKFLVWFAHPDGTFGGLYGSRRTTIYYPGGIASLGKEFPLAKSLSAAMLESIEAGICTTLQDVDMGNMAPLLSNYLMAVDPPDNRSGKTAARSREAKLPITGVENTDFPEAGIYVRNNAKYYCIIGASNGGTIKLFSKSPPKLVLDDGGYMAKFGSGVMATTQITDTGKSVDSSERRIVVRAPFHYSSRAIPSPSSYLFLRLLNLTAMRSVAIGNLIKKFLARALISPKRKAGFVLERSVTFDESEVRIANTINPSSTHELEWVRSGQPFVSIHMASAGYFEGHPLARVPLAKEAVEKHSENVYEF